MDSLIVTLARVFDTAASYSGIAAAAAIAVATRVWGYNKDVKLDYFRFRGLLIFSLALLFSSIVIKFRFDLIIVGIYHEDAFNAEIDSECEIENSTDILILDRYRCDYADLIADLAVSQIILSVLGIMMLLVFILINFYYTDNIGRKSGNTKDGD